MQSAVLAIVNPPIRPSVCHTLALCQNDSCYNHAVFTGGDMTLVSSWLTSSRNSKRNTGSGDAEWQIWIKIDPYYQRQKCRPMSLVSGNIRCMHIFAGFLLAGPQMRVGLSTTAIFGDLSGYFFGNFRDNASNIIWRYATPCWPVTDCKMNDLEWPWVAISRKTRFSH